MDWKPFETFARERMSHTPGCDPLCRRRSSRPRDMCGCSKGPRRHVGSLAFGIQRRVSKWRLEKYGGLVGGVEFYFRTDDGTAEQLRCARPMAAIVLRCTRRSVE